MLQYESIKRLNCEQLSQHPFLTKEIKDFHSIDIEKVSKKIDESRLKINVKHNKSIWAIFNADDEQKLVNIGTDCNKESNETPLSQNDNSQLTEKENKCLMTYIDM